MIASLTLAAGKAADQAATHAANGASGFVHQSGAVIGDPADMHPVLLVCVGIALIGLIFGFSLCLYRLVRGPHLADRVLAADLLSLHVVGLVIVLTLYLRSTAFFDAALAVGILGFVSTVGFAQYLHAVAGLPAYCHDTGVPRPVSAPPRVSS